MGRKNPLNIVLFWDARKPKPPAYWEGWISKNQNWVMIAKYDIDPDGFYFDDTLDATATAVALLTAEVNGKNPIESEGNFKLNLYLCIENEGNEFSRRANRG